MFDKLWFITVLFNPVHYSCRKKLYDNFKKHITDMGANLFTVELAYGDKPFEVTTGGPNELQLRTRAVLWHKERLINLAAQRLPIDTKYIAWVDSDLLWHNPNFMEDTVLRLQYHPIVQMFSHAMDLDKNYSPIGQPVEGFGYAYHHNLINKNSKLKYGRYAHTGYAWAMRSEVFDQMGGLIDFAILGAADNYMAHCAVGWANRMTDSRYHPIYNQKILDWEADCNRFIKGRLGYVPGTISHFWHGAKSQRGYNTRAQILIKNSFNPALDLETALNGTYRIDQNKHEMEHEIYHYFLSRNEDN